MKKKPMSIIIVIALIVTNVFLSTTPVTNNQSQLSLVLLEARADGEPEEIDPPDPGDEYPPLRPFPQNWTIPAIFDYLF